MWMAARPAAARARAREGAWGGAQRLGEAGTQAAPISQEGPAVRRRGVRAPNQMRACVMVEPQQGMTYERLLHVGRLARELGLEGTFRSDHYQPLGGEAPDEPATDAWATLAGLVRDLADGVVGTLVSPVTFRHPGQLAKVVATVAHMSAGPTVELGLGTGWNEAEHKAYGFSFGTFG